MMKTTRWIVSRVIPNHEEIENPSVRAQYGALEGWSSIVVNCLLFAIKLWLGLWCHSVSLITDAVHTIADSATSVVLLVSFKMAKKPADQEHPFGHGRAELVATLIISVLLFVAGFELLQHSVEAVIHPQVATAPWWVIIVISLTLIVKEGLAKFSFALGKIIDSKALMADALHHRTDVFATFLVVLALIGSRFGMGSLDGIMGILVSVVIFYCAYTIAKEAVDPLLGEAPPPGLLRKIEETAVAFSGVHGVHDIICHNYGNRRIVSLHIEVSDSEPVLELHQLSEQVEQAVARKIQGVAIAHIDPVNRNHPRYSEVEQTVQRLVSEDPRIASFHDLRIVGLALENSTLLFDLVLQKEVEPQVKKEIVEGLQEKMRGVYPETRFSIKVDPIFAYSPGPPYR